MRRHVFAAAVLSLLVLTACESESSPPGPPPPAPQSPAPPSSRASRGDGAELLYRGGGRASAQNPAFSPDGTSLLFTLFQGGYNDGAASLRVLPLTGGGHPGRPDTLLEDRDKAAVNLPGSSWHPSAGVAFASDRAGARDEVWVLPPGGRPTRVTEHDGDSGYLEPSFSPDGQWIVFQESKEKEGKEDEARGRARTVHGSIWKVRKDGSEATRLIDGPATGSDNRQPNWSPQGDRLVFQRRAQQGDDWALYVMNADGSGLRRLTDGPGEHTDASWSPDGRSVVYSSTGGGLDLPQIFVTGADGGRPVRVTRNDKSYDGAPSWSPDGRWIAFESHAGDDDAPASLWRIPAPGSH
ncbi:hypothetical protein ACFP1Z_15965 [Streptomyces gamaensis]|uniref:TolB protein n=1 Tax=Streptomyces gamaensis TaxID=1763542 RepID=A0ABW0Z3Q5_9ACTN